MFINFIIAEGGLAPAYIAALIGFIVFGAKIIVEKCCFPPHRSHTFNNCLTL